MGCRNIASPETIPAQLWLTQALFLGCGGGQGAGARRVNLKVVVVVNWRGGGGQMGGAGVKNILILGGVYSRGS